MHDIYKQKCLVKSIYLVLQIKHCKKVRSSIGFKDQGVEVPVNIINPNESKHNQF